MRTQQRLQPGDALIIVDVQNDFLPGGALGVPHGNEVVPALNRYITLFAAQKFPVIATRDWHPPEHCSFQAQGGTWPPHCIAGTAGADFAADLALPPSTVVLSKATERDRDAYSGFNGTDLAKQLRSLGVTRVFVGGLATDYCVLNTVVDAIASGFQVQFLKDAIRPVNVHPEDGTRAEQKMFSAGAKALTFDDVTGQ